MTALVVVSLWQGKYRYSRYEGRKLTHRNEFELPLSQYWVEEIRRAPEQFVKPQEPLVA